MICHYCQKDPGLKPGSEVAWYGFRDMDMKIYVCTPCRARHYMTKNKHPDYRCLYSEFPVIIPPAQLTIRFKR